MQFFLSNYPLRKPRLAKSTTDPKVRTASNTIPEINISGKICTKCQVIHRIEKYKKLDNEIKTGIEMDQKRIEMLSEKIYCPHVKIVKKEEINDNKDKIEDDGDSEDGKKEVEAFDTDSKGKSSDNSDNDK